jgi:hypothetical protein
MVKIFKYPFLISMVIILTGCYALRGAPDSPRPSNEALKDPAYLILPADMHKYNGASDPEKQKLIRNEIIDERILEIDYQFGEFEITLWKQGVGLGIGTDWVQLVLAGLTATVGSGSTKVVFGAAQAAVVGGKASFDKNAYMEKTLPVLMAQMVAERETIRAEIEEHKQHPVSEYNIYGAQCDLRRFIRSGSIPGVIKAIAQNAGEKTKKAEEDIKTITGKYLRDDAGDKLRAFWKPDGKTVNVDNAKKLNDWMEAHGLKTGPGYIPTFFGNPELADLRVRAVRDLIKE